MLGRRKGLFLAPVLVAVLLVGAVAGGCTSENTPATSGKPTTSSSAPASPSAPAPSAQQPAGELKIAFNSLSKEVLDPSLDSGPLTKPIMGPMYDYLVGVTVNGVFSKDYGLARDWKVEHSATNSVYTFDLRQGVKFHDGTEVTAQDVKFSLEYYTRKGSRSGNFANLKSTIDRIEAPSKYQVVVYTTKPYAFLLTDLSLHGQGEGQMLPKDYIEKNGTEYFNKHPVGTGPYKFKDQKQGTSITYEAIDYQHWLQQPKYKTVTLMLSPEESTRIAMLKTGEADAINSISTANISGLESGGMTVFSKKGGATFLLLLAQTWDENSYLNDIRVREALNLVVDRQSIVDQIFKKRGTPLGAWYGSWAYGYKAVPLYDYDPAKAKSLLQQAIKDKGWTKVEIMLYQYPYARIGETEAKLTVEAIGGMWQKALGDLINVQIVPAAEYAVLRQKMIDKMAANSAGLLGASNAAFWGTSWQSTSTSKSNYSLVKTPELDDLILNKLGGETDIEKIGQIQYTIATYLHDNYFNVPLFETDELWAGNPKKIPQWDLGKFAQDPNLRDVIVQGRAFPAQ
ncbi:MAG: ABC transporter substrate-binding protein [Chloroflexota bacterium]|nr:MAG: ABC transporter substrate-binding protein [Chloroflexota bacterium]